LTEDLILDPSSPIKEDHNVAEPRSIARKESRPGLSKRALTWEQQVNAPKDPVRDKTSEDLNYQDLRDSVYEGKLMAMEKTMRDAHRIKLPILRLPRLLRSSLCERLAVPGTVARRDPTPSLGRVWERRTAFSPAFFWNTAMMPDSLN